MNEMPEEYVYLWRRLWVIACEDVGPADDLLTLFVVACSTVFSSRKTSSDNHRLMCFLIEKMCDLPSRSRIYCSCGALELLSDAGLRDLSGHDEVLRDASLQQKRLVEVPLLPPSTNGNICCPLPTKA